MGSADVCTTRTFQPLTTIPPIQHTFRYDSELLKIGNPLALYYAWFITGLSNGSVSLFLPCLSVITNHSNGSAQLECLQLQQTHEHEFVNMSDMKCVNCIHCLIVPLPVNVQGQCKPFIGRFLKRLHILVLS